MVNWSHKGHRPYFTVVCWKKGIVNDSQVQFCFLYVLLTLYFFSPWGSGDLCSLSPVFCLVYSHIPFPPTSAVLAPLSLRLCAVLFVNQQTQKSRRENFRLRRSAQCHHVSFRGEAVARKLFLSPLASWAWECFVHTEYPVIFSFQASKKPLSILQTLGKKGGRKKEVGFFFPFLSIGAKIPQ